jgi:hypothetical protein
MSRRLRWFLLVLVALVAVYTVACVGGPEDPVELNPQPLPPAPGQGGETDPDKGTSGGSSASSSGSSTFGDGGVNPPPKNDAGDAGRDAGDAGGDQ